MQGGMLLFFRRRIVGGPSLGRSLIDANKIYYIIMLIHMSIVTMDMYSFQNIIY